MRRSTWRPPRNGGAEANDAASVHARDVDRPPPVADPPLQVDELPAVDAARSSRCDEAAVPHAQSELRPHVHDRRRPADERAELDVVLGPDRRLDAERPGAVRLGDGSRRRLDPAIRRHEHADLLAPLGARDAAGKLDRLAGGDHAPRDADRHGARLGAPHGDRAALIRLDRAAIAVGAGGREVVRVALTRLEQRRLEAARVGDDLACDGVLVRPRDRVVRGNRRPRSGRSRSASSARSGLPRRPARRRARRPRR